MLSEAIFPVPFSYPALALDTWGEIRTLGSAFSQSSVVLACQVALLGMGLVWSTQRSPDTGPSLVLDTVIS